jgi:two-component system, LytTR family, response regulator
MLLENDADVASIRTANNCRQAVRAIRAGGPDLVFLDIQMPGLDGFSVIEEIGTANMPSVVFVTAHDEYAVRAFEANAVDYFLKPFTEERFAAGWSRAKENAARTNLESLMQDVHDRCIERMAVKRVTGSATLLIPVDSIEWIIVT